MAEQKQTPNIVFGATGFVGSYIVDQLANSGKKPIGVSRKEQPTNNSCDWIQGDLLFPDELQLPATDVIYSTGNARHFGPALPRLLRSPVRRIVIISSSSVWTKISSPDPIERFAMEDLAAAEDTIIRTCEAHSVEWTILRPTLIYREGVDPNVTRLASIIRRFGFLPLNGTGNGLRQPIHAEDLAIGAIASAASAAAANKAYYVSGSDTISYREMTGRIFDALGKPRRMISLPPPVWSLAFAVARPLFPGISGVMGRRMSEDLVFDSSDARADFGWKSRGFYPRFGSAPSD